MLDKSSIKVNDVEKLHNVEYVARYKSLLNDFDFLFLHSYFFEWNNEFKKIYFVSESFTFFKSNVKLILFKTIENSFDVVNINFDIYRVNYYIIQIHYDVDIETSR